MNDSQLAIQLMKHIDASFFKRVSQILDTLEVYDSGAINIISIRDGQVFCDNINDVADTLYQKLEFVKSHHLTSTFKIEGLESDASVQKMRECLGNCQEFDCHLFLNFCDNAPSFDLHSDDKNVVLLLLKGHKVVEIQDQKPVTLTPGKCVRIPQRVPHSVTTLKPSIALSLGYV